MSLPLPSFLRRRLLLLAARRALLAGHPEEALGHLDDPCLAPVEDAERLRAQVMEVLCRDAQRLAAEGREGSAARLLERIGGESPPLARAWRRRLRLSPAASEAADEDEPRSGSELDPQAERRIQSALANLLSQLRDEVGPTPLAARSAAARPPPSQPAARLGLRFHLAVDEAGELFFVHGERLVLGHASGGRADVPLLGDVEREHLALSRAESFHGGPAWRVEPLARRVLVEGRELPPEGRELADGDLVRLAPQVAFRYRRPEAASGSALLELLHGLECEGASRVVLLVEGPAGRIRMGARQGRHVIAPGLQDDVELELDRERGELLVRSRAALEVRGWDPRPTPGMVRLPCPPPAPIDVRVGAAQRGRPPQGFALRGPGPPSASGGPR